MSGKGDKPRNCHSQQFRDNHDSIDWSKGRPAPKPKKLTFNDLVFRDCISPVEWIIPTLEEILGTGAKPSGPSVLVLTENLNTPTI